jgi:hypothetical protein
MVPYSSNWPPRSKEPLQNDVDDADAGNTAATDVAIAVKDDESATCLLHRIFLLHRDDGAETKSSCLFVLRS